MPKTAEQGEKCWYHTETVTTPESDVNREGREPGRRLSRRPGEASVVRDVLRTDGDRHEVARAGCGRVLVSAAVHLKLWLVLGFGTSTLGAYLISATVGLFGVHEVWTGV